MEMARSVFAYKEQRYLCYTYRAKHNSPVNLRVLDGPDQTNCNRIFFTATQTRMVY